MTAFVKSEREKKLQKIVELALINLRVIGMQQLEKDCIYDTIQELENRLKEEFSCKESYIDHLRKKATTLSLSLG